MTIGLIVFLFMIVLAVLYTLARMQAGKLPVRKQRVVLKQSTSGNIIYRGLNGEMSGPVGTEVRRLLRESCLQSPLTATIPNSIIENIHTNSLQGKRADEIAAGLMALLPDMDYEQLESIARTIIGKASTALDRVRSEKIGIHWYVWETCQDVRVRKSHRKMQGVLVAWNDPPSPERLVGEKIEYGNYHAGESIECRCCSLPLADLSEVRWPHRVYQRGSIQRMTRVQFKQISGMSE